MLVVGNWGLRGPAHFFVCLFYQLLNDAQNCIGFSPPQGPCLPRVTLSSQKLHTNSPPQGPLSFPGSLCLPWASLSVFILESRELMYVFCWAPCCIVGLCWGFVWKSKLFNTCELWYFHHAVMAYSGGLPSCSFQLIALFGLWLLNINFSGYSQPLCYVWLSLTTFACEAKGLPWCAFLLLSKGVMVEGCLNAQRCFISPQSFAQLVSKCL